MRMLVAFLLTVLAVILQNCYVQSTHCPPPTQTCGPQLCYKEDGSCNNLATVRAGSKDSPYERFISRLIYPGGPAYESFLGYPLPTPRTISRDFFTCHSYTNSIATHLFTIFGRLLMLDMYDTQRNAAADGCLNNGYGIDTSVNNDPRNDPTNPACACLNYNKPILGKYIDCSGSDTEGKNKVTHVMDLSFMYSSVHYGGTLTSGMFPLTNNLVPLNHVLAKEIKEDPLMLSLFNIFIREHNRLTAMLQGTCGAVADCTKKAKALLTAMFQHIVCKEFLPLLLGSSTTVRCLGTTTRAYSSNDLPMVSHDFAAAYKLIMISMSRDSVTIGSGAPTALKPLINDPTVVDTDAKMTGIIKGMLKDCSLKAGREVSCEFRNDCKFSDLVSILLQDVRVLGIPPYVIYLAIPPGSTSLPTDFTGFIHHSLSSNSFPPFASVYDVDLLSGGSSENLVPGAMVGPTFKKIFEETFQSLQVGDRFYFENTGVFSPDQLGEIRKVTMAHLLCRNVNGLTEVKQNAFECSSTKVQCSNLPDVDVCKLCGISAKWGPFKPLSVKCVKVQILVRDCLSTNPIKCPCLVGEGPFKTAPCQSPIGGAITDPFFLAKLNILNAQMAKDPDCINSYNNGDYISLQNRTLYLLSQLI